MQKTPNSRVLPAEKQDTSQAFAAFWREKMCSYTRHSLECCNKTMRLLRSLSKIHDLATVYVKSRCWSKQKNCEPMIHLVATQRPQQDV